MVDSKNSNVAKISQLPHLLCSPNVDILDLHCSSAKSREVSLSSCGIFQNPSCREGRLSGPIRFRWGITVAVGTIIT